MQLTAVMHAAATVSYLLCMPYLCHVLCVAVARSLLWSSSFAVYCLCTCILASYSMHSAIYLSARECLFNWRMHISCQACVDDTKQTSVCYLPLRVFTISWGVCYVSGSNNSSSPTVCCGVDQQYTSYSAPQSMQYVEPAPQT